MPSWLNQNKNKKYTYSCTSQLFVYFATLYKTFFRYMKTIKLLAAALIVSLFLSACHTNTADETTKDEDMDQATTTEANTPAQKGITQKVWGNYNGKQVHLFTLTNGNGVQVSISDYGGTITHL